MWSACFQHALCVSEVLETGRLRGDVQSPNVLYALLVLDRFREAFDAVQAGRTNSFHRHDRSPGSYRNVTRLPILEPERVTLGKAGDAGSAVNSFAKDG
jgi:hypothetical protein